MKASVAEVKCVKWKIGKQEVREVTETRSGRALTCTLSQMKS